MSKNEDLLRERIRTTLNHHNVSIADLVDRNESQRSKVSRQLNGGIGVTLSTVQLVLNSFPDVSAEWLLRGEGSMDKSQNLAPHIYTGGGHIVAGNENRGDIEISTPSQYELYGKDALITEKDDTIARLTTQIQELRADKETLRLVINTLTNKK